ncbi:MAG: 16S rRNA (cytosine(1402)-N(4))-methyltransferase RsmH [Candidatus Kerfeldbacteria bacterium]|nr:16S rRNA (cytosine(1402)-N(4))-methyltransferase RsmH [Candidatus Kerfeldbacteria bacterium]
MHISVLLHEVIDGLQLQPNTNVVDATLGYGGHTQLALDNIAPHGKVIAFERDLRTMRATQERLKAYGDRLICIHGSYAELRERAEEIRKHGPIHAIMADLGLSSLQLDQEQRGFSFRFQSPLDMRFDETQQRTAATLLRDSDERTLQNIFTRYGDVPFARRLSQRIVQERSTHPLHTTSDLIMCVESCVGKRIADKHMAQIFQSVRIAVNDELAQLEAFLPASIASVESGGRIAIISFHSGEDRMVKRFFEEEATDCVCPPEFPECRCTHRARIWKVTKKPIEPSEIEIHTNPRARSAKLRIVEKK